MNLNEQQQTVVKTIAPKVIVASCAGSGKTRTLTARCQYLVEQGEDPTKIVLITFTTAAANEIQQRLNPPRGLFIGTIHAYANYLLRAYGLETEEYLSDSKFDKLFEQVQDNPQCIKPVNHLLLDEGQDTGTNQLHFIFDLVRPKNWMVFADWRQTLYSWNGADPDYFIGLSKQPDVTNYSLTINYRNALSILSFAKSIIRGAGSDYQDDSIAARDVIGKVVPNLDYSPDAIAKTFLQIGQDYGKWFILARTNAQVEQIAWALSIRKIPYDTFKRSQLEESDFALRMSNNTVKVLTIHASKGLEADNVIVVGARFYNTEERCVSYVAATRARNRLYWMRGLTYKQRMGRTSNWEV